MKEKKEEKTDGQRSATLSFNLIHLFFFKHLPAARQTNKQKKKRKTCNKYQAVLQWPLWNIEDGREIIFTKESHSKANLCCR